MKSDMPNLPLEISCQNLPEFNEEETLQEIMKCFPTPKMSNLGSLEVSECGEETQNFVIDMNSEFGIDQISMRF
jgi:hypothetical protein